MAQQIPPPAKNMTPRQYFDTLVGQGVAPYQAYQAVQGAYGPPKSPEDRAKDNANAEQNAGLAQTAGTVGGLLGARYLIGQLAGSGAATAGAGATGASVATPTLVGASQVGTGGTAAAGGAGAAGAGGAAAEGSSLGAAGSVALPIAAIGLGLNNMWETGMKDILRGRGDRADWTNQAVNVAPILGVPGTGGLINLGLRLAGKRSVGQMMTTGKSDAQLQRDDFRGLLKQTGVADKNYHVTLADGSKFNIGLDGKTRYQNVGKNIDGKTERQAWDVDFSNPLAKFATDKIDPMIRNIYAEAGSAVKPEQYTGMLVNAVTSNAKSEKDVLNNINAILGQSDFVKQAGGAVPVPKKPLSVAPKGEVVRVSPGMYVNDKGHVGPASTVRQALEANYKKK